MVEIVRGQRVAGPAPGRYAFLRPLCRGLAVAGSIGLLGLVMVEGWRATQRSGDGPAPLIHADASPTRVQPERPGGLMVPHQQVQLLQSRGSGGPPAGDRVLLPPPEQPLGRPALDDWPELDVADLPSAADSASLVAFLEGGLDAPMDADGPQLAAVFDGSLEAAEALIMRLDPIEEGGGLTAAVLAADGPRPVLSAALVKAESADAPPPPGPAPDMTLDDLIKRTVFDQPPQDEVPAIDEAKVADAAAVLPSPAPAGTHRVQLATLSSEEAAGAEGTRLKGLHPDLLAPVTLGVAPLQQNGRTLYRVMAGPMDEAGARTLCDALRARGGDCLVR